MFKYTTLLLPSINVWETNSGKVKSKICHGCSETVNKNCQNNYKQRNFLRKFSFFEKFPKIYIYTQAEIESLQSRLTESQSQIDELKRLNECHERDIELIRGQLDRCREENEILRHDYDEAKRELDDRSLENSGQIVHLEKMIVDLKQVIDC